MTSSHFSDIANTTYAHARECRAFAVSLEVTEPKASRTWHALADRLYEAAEQADNMTEATA